MSRQPLSNRELERRLSEVPGDPKPPADLLRLLKADIPSDLGRPAAPPAPPWWRTHGLRAAAAVLLMVGTGIAALLFWPRMEMPQERADSLPVSESAAVPTEDLQREAREEGALETAAVDAEAADDSAAPEAFEDTAFETEAEESAQLQSLGYRADVSVPKPSRERGRVPPPPPARPAPPPPARPAPEPVTVLRGGAPQIEADQGVEAEALLAAPPPPAPPPPPASPPPRQRQLAPQATIEDEIRVTGEAPEVISVCTTSAQTAADAAGLDPAGFTREVSDRPFVATREDRLSTFGLDVDTGSYTLSRRYLTEGRLPPPNVLRVEEWINAVDMGDPAPAAGQTFAFTFEGAPSPFAGEGDMSPLGGARAPFGDKAGQRVLLRLGLRAREVTVDERRPTALTFLVDTSGSMRGDDRIGLVRKSLARLAAEAREGDTVAVVSYGSEARVELPPTEDLSVLPQAAAALTIDGSTNLESGLRLAYSVAARHQRPEVDHRLILLSDGVANQGATEVEALLRSIEDHADRGIELSTIGLGMGDYRDDLMEQLADRGDGRYAYADRPADLDTAFFEALHGIRRTVAEEARMQIEWNPASVLGYRLLGYENRAIADHEFRYHRTDGGEVGAGHTVSALYEIILTPTVPPGRNLGIWRLRYRDPDSRRFVEETRRLEFHDLTETWSRSPTTLRFSGEIAEAVHVLGRHTPARAYRLEGVAKRLDELLRDPASRDVDPKMREMAEMVARAAEIARREP